MDPLSLLLFARDNKVEQIEAAIALGLPPDTGNGVRALNCFKRSCTPGCVSPVNHCSVLRPLEPAL